MSGINQRGMEIGSRVRNNALDEIFIIDHIDEAHVYYRRPYEKYVLFSARTKNFFNQKCWIEEKGHKFIFELCEEDFE